MSRDSSTCIELVKIGGSVLRGVHAFRRCAEFLRDELQAHPDRRLVVVVSAEFGATDELAALAGSITAFPQPEALDLLWSTGELRSVALLTLGLQQAGIDAKAANVHETGLGRGPGDGLPARVNPLKLARWSAEHAVVVVPGFLARGGGEEIVNLGRGGSDLSAVLLTAALAARQCTLVKDVPGYFTKDPAFHADAAPVTSLTYQQALIMAEEGCDLVQRDAIVEAQRRGLRLVIRGLDGLGHSTFVSAEAEKGLAIQAECAAA